VNFRDKDGKDHQDQACQCQLAAENSEGAMRMRIPSICSTRVVALSAVMHESGTQRLLGAAALGSLRLSTGVSMPNRGLGTVIQKLTFLNEARMTTAARTSLSASGLRGSLFAG